MTRFPPEPNGYLHIGHAKSICLNFGLAREFGGMCNLRFDDTNPETEDPEFVESIERDVRWLGFDWEDRKYFASDYFEQLYEFAVQLIREGKAYVDSRTPDEIRAHARRLLPSPARRARTATARSPRTSTSSERMRAGEFPDGIRVLRAKIDMASTDVKLRDPVMYRIRRAHHHRTGDKWCIYPMYDWAHGQSDAHRRGHPLDLHARVREPPAALPLVPRRARARRIIREQIEFARLNLTYTVLSKRKLQELVEGRSRRRAGTIPGCRRSPGMRRRGYTPDALRDFCERIGVSTRDSWSTSRCSSTALREDLNAHLAARDGRARARSRWCSRTSPRAQVEELDAPYDPEKPERAVAQGAALARALHRAGRLLREPAKKWFRLAPGQEVRLRYACIIRCNEVVKNAAGEVVELRCTWDPESRGGNAADGRKVKGTLHWVSAAHAVDGRGAPLRSALLRGEPAQGQGRRLQDAPEPRLARGPRTAAGSSRASRAQPARSRSSSSGSATSASTAIRSRELGVQPDDLAEGLLGGSGEQDLAFGRRGSAGSPALPGAAAGDAHGDAPTYREGPSRTDEPRLGGRRASRRPVVP